MKKAMMLKNVGFRRGKGKEKVCFFFFFDRDEVMDDIKLLCRVFEG